MTIAAPDNHDHAANGDQTAQRSVREQFIERSEGWIRRVAEELPEDALAAAMADMRKSWDLSAAMEALGDIDPIHRALMLRTVRALTRIVHGMSGDLLVSALAAPSDFGALARALGDPRMAGPSRELDPLAGAVGRSIEHRKRLADMAGEMLTSSQVEEFLGIRRQAIDKRRNAGKLLGVRQGSDWLYPAFQFGDEDVLEGLPAVLATYEDTDPWVIIDILLAPDEVLGGRSLLDALRDGDTRAVERHLHQAAGDGFE